MIAGNQLAMQGGQTANAAGSNWLKLSVLAALLLACYFPMLLMTGRTILFGDDMAHGLFAPIVALYIAWDRRDVLAHSAPPSFWSLPLLLAASACVLWLRWPFPPPFRGSPF
jgi:Transmembrane exosortase (Exosortase_EpsH)